MHVLKVPIANTRMGIFFQRKQLRIIIVTFVYVKLRRGLTGGENEDYDDVQSIASDKDDQQHDSSSQMDFVNPEEMPESYCFSVMIAEQCGAVYQSEQL